MLKGGLSVIKSLGGKAWTAGAVASVLAVMLPSSFVEGLLLSTGVLIALDTVTGVWAAKKNGRPIRSAKFGRLVEKVFGTAVLWLVLALVGDVIGQMLGAERLGEVLISFGIGSVFLKEALSILENLVRIGIYVPKKLKAKIKEWLGDLEDKA